MMETKEGYSHKLQSRDKKKSRQVLSFAKHNSITEYSIHHHPFPPQLIRFSSLSHSRLTPQTITSHSPSHPNKHKSPPSNNNLHRAQQSGSKSADSQTPVPHS